MDPSRCAQSVRLCILDSLREAAHSLAEVSAAIVEEEYVVSIEFRRETVHE